MLTLPSLVAEWSELLTTQNLYLVCAESCTGGMLASACTSVVGASSWFDRAWVTYSNSAKIQLLGIDPALITSCGAVSSEVALAMAENARLRAEKPASTISIAVTGIAGPGGGSKAKPVGTVYIAWSRPPLADKEPQRLSQRFLLQGDRQAIRLQATKKALEGAIRWLNPQDLMTS
ncbi:MAG: CinA family protein [Gammaproteobacteria bacterium]|nr:CinA family protein [Gammaproteobacteria bacterium]